MKTFSLLIFFFFFALWNSSHALNNGLGLLPQMGYNSWYDLQCSSMMNENTIKETALAMIELGFHQLGYTYINLDDCWAKGRDGNGVVYPDSNTFPSGMKSLADYIHSLDLKFGVYTDRGTLTCGGRPGSNGYESIDAKTYASWGVDYVKEDSCYASSDHETAFTEYGKMRDALNATGRPIFFSLCGWNDWYAPVGYSLGNSWRIGPDTTDWAHVLQNIDIESNLAKYSGPGGWNDPCLLISQDYQGNFQATEVQSRTQFSMWAIMASPLIISGNLRNLSKYNFETYTNEEVIAVDQDPLCQQGIRVVGDNLSGGGLFMRDCSSSDPNQQWTMNSPMNQFLQNQQNHVCLNLDDCQNDLILYTCVTSGGTCAGANNYSNEQWIFTSSGQLQSVFNSECVTIQPGKNLETSPCISPTPVNQTFTYNSSTKTISNPITKTCLSILSSPSTTNVWGRNLFDGSVALVFLNNGKTKTQISCDEKCFAKLGIHRNSNLLVRDLWLHSFVGQTTPAKGWTVSVDPNGASSMFRFYIQH